MHEAQARATIQRFVEMDANGYVPKGSMLGRLLGFGQWLEAGMCMIRDKNERIVELIPNRAQIVAIATMMTQAAVNKPIRLVILKARKVGITTLFMALHNYLAAHHANQIGCTLAHGGTSTDDIFEISKTIAEHYTAMLSRQTARHIRYPLTSSRLWSHTAGGSGIGAGGTPNLMHLSERALWMRNQVSTETAAVNAVPGTPTSVMVYESTARGRESFWQRYEAAKGSKSGYEALFIPWYYDDILTAPPAVEFDRDADERILTTQAHDEGIELSDGQLQWRRNTIADLGPRIFKQEFPSTAQEAVETAKGLVVPGLRECVCDSLPFDSVGVDDLVGGVDFGYHDPTAILTGYYVDQCLYVTSMFHGSHTLAADRVAGVVDGHTYYCDPSGLQDRKELIEACRVGGTEDKPAKMQAVFVQAPRADGSLSSIVEAEWQAVRTMIDERRLFIVANVAERLCMEADNLFYGERTGQPDMIRSEVWGHFDTLDALRYMIMGVTMRVKSVPQMPPPPSSSRVGGLRRF